MLPLKEWLQSAEYRRIDALSMGELVTTAFFRDPLRPAHIDPDAFYAPADGTIVYVHESIKPTEPIVNVKGRNFTVQQLLDNDKYNYNSIYIGIFMSSRDVHTNRIPCGGYLTQERSTPYLYTKGISMIDEENGILNEDDIDDNDMSYLFKNQRKIVKVYSPRIKGSYFLVQISDRDIGSCIVFGKNAHYHQCERFGQVRWGSQVDLVVVLTGKVRYEILAKRGYHVEAGVDKIIQIVS